ncbi:MAG: bifunctional [glutamine synthetase] adenylyltransferase/[glutamine synthetase]-adenylyl-L-tyrosine phosphorylase [Actinobacteria bacterium]|nr:bifunctional [glutamine synthetase] adenylyltransferase/[glutamine synthetase]-adenylyl-L-tyrosine phosphorylase [Actinomycetota bacterium]
MKTSPARLGLADDDLPRLRALGWMNGEELQPEVVKLLQSVRSGADPLGTLKRVLALAERTKLPPTLAVDWTALAGASKSLWESTLRHPEWLDGESTESADPRVFVQQHLVEIARRDLSGEWPLERVVAHISATADHAAKLALASATKRFGERTPPDKAPPPIAVIALGKWGAEELNYASDIDLVFVAGDGDLRAAVRIATSFIDQLATPTAEGLAFRVDVDLRPEGTTGPLVRTLASYRAYYERWGEPWEFQALLKARPVAGDLELGQRFREMVDEFVWQVGSEGVRELRRLKQRSEEEANPNDIKRAPGGIRDVEFTIQLLQLIHGRADTRLQVTGTFGAIAALIEGDYVRAEDAQSLADSYRFLRKVEHRLQLWQMAQTHQIPAERADLALNMGYRPGDLSAEGQLNRDLHEHRRRVRELHEALYYRPLLEAYTSSTGLTREQADDRLAALGFQDPAGAARSFEDLTSGLSRRSRLMNQLLPLMLEWLADTPHPDLGLTQLAKLVSTSPDQTALVSVLRDRPVAGRYLCRLVGSSRWIGHYLDRIPEFLPRLGDDRLLLDLPIGAAVAEMATERMRLRQDRGSRMASLRRLVRRRALRVAAADLLDLVEVETVSSALSDTADAAATAALWTAQQESPGDLVIVAMGKWGGHELGYGSDLDLVYAGDPQTGLKLAAEVGAVLGQPTADGIAYRVDLDLRPEGKQGALVRSLDAYRLYYQSRAEPWELLALIKARPVAGPPNDRLEFEAIRRECAFPVLVTSEMLRSIRHIKARIERERLPRGEDPEFHLKLGPGGLSDIEFLAQLWQLRLGAKVESLQTTSTVGALAALEGEGVLTSDECRHLVATYRFCTRLRNRLFLQTGSPHDALPIEGAEIARLAQSLGYRDRGTLREEYRSLTRRSRRIFARVFFEGPE